MKPKLENLSYKGNAKLDAIICPLCHEDQFKILLVEHGLPVVRCQVCHLVFVNPRPGPNGLKEFYENYFPPESESLWQEQMAQVFLNEGLKQIEAYQRREVFQPSKPPSLLDIGCGMGFFLDLMRSRGWEVKGIEPAPAAVKHAREKLKLDVIEGTIEQAKISGPFDIITLWYVLEHVPNPHDILDRVVQLLKPGGLLIIRVPNQNVTIDQWLSFFRLGRYFLINPPRHLFDYSPKTLSLFLTKRQFDILEIRNSLPRATGTWLELLRRYVWYGCFQVLYYLSKKKVIRGSSITLYAKKK